LQFQPLRASLEASAALIFGETSNGSLIPWPNRIPQALMDDSGRYRDYDPISVVDCLRLLRNKRAHFLALSPEVRKTALGSANAPVAALMPIFAKLFPHLLLVTWNSSLQTIAHDAHGATLFGTATAARYAPASLAAAKALISLATKPVISPSSLSMNWRQKSIASPVPSTTSLTSPSSPSTFFSPVPVNNHPSTDLVQQHWFCTENDWILTPNLPTDSRLIVSATIDGEGNINANIHPSTVTVVCAHTALMRETTFKGGAHTGNNRYKSAVCSNFDTVALKCPRGIRCDFAHSPLELRARVPPLSSSAASIALEHMRTILQETQLQDSFETPSSNNIIGMELLTTIYDTSINKATKSK
jgi:Ribonuclease 2-5A